MQIWFLVSKQSPSPNIFIESIILSYNNANIKLKDLKFHFCKMSPETILNDLKDLNPSKATGIDP